jgi:hypothetical protein
VMAPTSDYHSPSTSRSSHSRFSVFQRSLSAVSSSCGANKRTSRSCQLIYKQTYMSAI